MSPSELEVAVRDKVKLVAIAPVGDLSIRTYLTTSHVYTVVAGAESCVIVSIRYDWL